MKREQRRIVWTIMLLAITFGLFCGCGNPSQQALPPIDMTVESPAEQTNDTLIPVEIEKEPVVPTEREPWIPEIIDRDDASAEPDDFDDSVQYTYSVGTLSFSTVNGGFTTDTGGASPVYRTTAANSMTVCSDVAAPFPYGTISCIMKAAPGSDNGIVFGLSSNKPSYWEGSGISYYFFFLSQGGLAYLGKTHNGTWSALQTVSFSFNAADNNALKVVMKNGKICCYVNDTLLIGYKDSAPLAGTGFGFRGGASGIEFSNLQITNEYLYA